MSCGTLSLDSFSFRQVDALEPRPGLGASRPMLAQPSPQPTSATSAGRSDTQPPAGFHLDYGTEFDGPCVGGVQGNVSGRPRTVRLTDCARVIAVKKSIHEFACHHAPVMSPTTLTAKQGL